jgi:hypothetical protein
MPLVINDYFVNYWVIGNVTDCCKIIEKTDNQPIYNIKDEEILDYSYSKETKNNKKIEQEKLNNYINTYYNYDYNERILKNSQTINKRYTKNANSNNYSKYENKKYNLYNRKSTEKNTFQYNSLYKSINTNKNKNEMYSLLSPSRI